jgi:hypothetical protein
MGKINKSSSISRHLNEYIKRQYRLHEINPDNNIIRTNE